MADKTCKKCGLIKKYAEFSTYRDKYKNLKYKPRCKECHKAYVSSVISPEMQREYGNKWRSKQDKDQFKMRKSSNMMKCSYGIDMETYMIMSQKQDGKCLICKTPQSQQNMRMAIDHCHTTGKIRGILCSLCNSGLGHFRDNTKTMQKAIEYLKFHKKLG